MAQLSISDGDSPTAAQLNDYAFGEGGAWTSWTPTVTQSGSVTVTNTRSRYARYGRTIHAVVNLTVTGSGTGANAITVTIPVAAATTQQGFGTGRLYDVSTTTSYPFAVEMFAAGSVALLDTIIAGGPSPYLGLQSFTAALASGDVIRFGLTYEAAS